MIMMIMISNLFILMLVLIFPALASSEYSKLLQPILFNLIVFLDFKSKKMKKIFDKMDIALINTIKMIFTKEILLKIMPYIFYLFAITLLIYAEVFSKTN